MSEDISEKRDKALKVLIYGFNAVITPLNSDELLKKIADSIKKLLKADNVTVQISEQVERQEALVGGSHSTNAGADQVKTLEEDVESLSEIQIYHPTVPGSYSELSIPLVTNRGVFGVLNIELETNKENANLSQSDLEALRALTDMVVIAIQAAHSTQKLAATKRNLRLLLKTSSNSDSKLNPLFFINFIVPYLEALTRIQDVIDEIHGRSPTNIEILAIRKGSVTVDITGGIRDTVELVMDLIVPYRRKTKKRQAELDVATKEIEVKQKEADLKKAQATLEADSEQANVDVEKAQAEVALLRQQERELALKNKRQELELFELTLAMVDKIKADLPDSERLYYATKLLDPTRLIATSPLELISAEPISSADGLGGEPGVQ